MNSQVQVLLSTFNGEKYLEVQINSILNQRYSNISLLIRDDGSTDGTIDILKRFEKYNNIKVIYGSNIGIFKSYMTLLENADESADYFSFSDQDDYWKNDKIEKAIAKLHCERSNIPLLYCSDTTLVNEKLQTISDIRYEKEIEIRPSVNNSIIENISTGSTIVINKIARNVLLQHLPQNLFYHDWWMYLVVSVIGIVIYDNYSGLFYRQHEENTCGVKRNIYKQWGNRIKNVLNNKYKTYVDKQCREFLLIYYKYADYDGYKLIHEYLVSKKSLVKRLKFIYRNKIYRQNKKDTYLYDLAFVFGLF